MPANRVLLYIFFLVFFAVFSTGKVNAQEQMLEDFETINFWKVTKTEGVKARLDVAAGKEGKAMVINFDFPQNKAYVIAGKEKSFNLPDDYKFTFYIKGPAPDNNLEFKLIDKAGNTHWKVFQNFAFTPEWKKVIVRKEDITFGWGPSGGGEIKDVAKIEFVISCGSGGKGSVYIDQLELKDTSVVRTKYSMTAKASSIEKDIFTPDKAVDGDMTTRWTSAFEDNQWIELDLGSIRDFVGIDIYWETAFAKKYEIYTAKTKGDWEKIYHTDKSNGGLDEVYFGRKSGRYFKIHAIERATEWGNSIYEITIKGPEYEVKLAASSGLSRAYDAMDGNLETSWMSDSAGEQSLIIDLGGDRNTEGLLIDWGKNYATSYKILTSKDKKQWQQMFETTESSGKMSRVFFRDTEGRFIKIQCLDSKFDRYEIAEIQLCSYRGQGNLNGFYSITAENSPMGYYPKYFHNLASYWTVVGVTKDRKEALVNEEGAFEVGREEFSVEPFIYMDDKLITWADVSLSQYLEKEYLPIPTVTWKHKNISMDIKIFAHGEPDESSIYAIYRITNRTDKPQKGKLYLTIRPFQVSPPWQKLNMEGGVTTINSISYDGNSIKVNERELFPLINPENFGAAAFRDGDITDFIEKGKVPESKSTKDKEKYASAAMEYSFDLAKGEYVEYYLAVPFHKKHTPIIPNVGREKASLVVNKKLEQMIDWWDDHLNKVSFKVPQEGKKFINSFKSNLAYVFINMDNSRIQPGSRSYLRSWIRDGSMTSSALLRTGNTREVKDYLSMYSKYLFADGRVPCVVDDRGADPCPENDSNGEFIYAFLQYYYFTKDAGFLRQHYPQIKKSADFIIQMSNERKTPEYKNGPDNKRVLYGLVPESISHEGYSNAPMHSYWDDFFSLKGLKDAATIAEIIGETQDAERYKTESLEFRKNLYNSINLAMKMKEINFIPGCAEKGDFDATSTAIGLFPCGENKYMPQPALDNTFNKYYQYFLDRCDPDYTWYDMTPYEIRTCQSFIVMDRKERALKMFDYFFTLQRPSNWNHWGEIVFKDPMPGRWIGDMPHTWIGSSFMNAVRTMFVYEREWDNSLILAAGIPEEWLCQKQEVAILNAPTYWGFVSWSMQKSNNSVIVDIQTKNKVSPVKVVLKSPLALPIKSVVVDGKTITSFTPDEAMIEDIPSRVIIYY